MGLRVIGLCMVYIRGLVRGSEREREAYRMLAMYRASYRRETGEDATELMVIEAMRRRRVEMEGKFKDAEKEGEPVENSLHPNGRECQASLRRCPYEVKGSRATKGNPRAKTTRSNTPLKAAPAAKPQAKVDAIEHALRTTLKKGGKVEDVAKIGGESVTIEHGKPGIKKLDYQRGFGSSHQYAKHGDETKEKTTQRKAAITLVHGKRRWDEEHGTVAHELGSRAAYTRPLKKGKSTFQSAHRKD